jgi:hypothetical protein
MPYLLSYSHKVTAIISTYDVNNFVLVDVLDAINYVLERAINLMCLWHEQYGFIYATKLIYKCYKVATVSLSCKSKITS